MINKIIRNLLPVPLVNKLIEFKYNVTLIFHYIYDFRIYKINNGKNKNLNQNQIEGRIIAHYHVLEKGFSHPNPKICFSLPLVLDLVELIVNYEKKGYKRTAQVDVAINLLKKYKKQNYKYKCLDPETKNKIDNMVVCNSYEVGFKTFTNNEFFKNAESDFSLLADSRYSLRDFSDEEVSLRDIISAIEIAQKSPSVCNRQTSRVYILTNKNEIKAHLQIQNGNRGFGNKINKLLIITSDLNYFYGVEERNQAFVDGGIFAMSLLYALHHKKIGAITLNWAYSSSQNEELHNLGIVPKDKKVILFIGVGHAPAKFKVACSNRRDVNEIINII